MRLELFSSEENFLQLWPRSVLVRAIPGGVVGLALFAGLIGQSDALLLIDWSSLALLE